MRRRMGIVFLMKLFSIDKQCDFFLWQTEPFQKPVSLDQHPDYAEYIFHPMDLCTLEKVCTKLRGNGPFIFWVWWRFRSFPSWRSSPFSSASWRARLGEGKGQQGLSACPSRGGWYLCGIKAQQIRVTDFIKWNDFSLRVDWNVKHTVLCTVMNNLFWVL